MSPVKNSAPVIGYGKTVIGDAAVDVDPAVIASAGIPVRIVGRVAVFQGIGHVAKSFAG
jgi:hypothetical protein